MSGSSLQSLLPYLLLASLLVLLAGFLSVSWAIWTISKRMKRTAATNRENTRAKSATRGKQYPVSKDISAWFPSPIQASELSRMSKPNGGTN